MSTVRYAGTEIYQGAGRAIRRPFHDLNLMQDQIAPVLLRAESHPYDLADINSCSDVLDRVGELDLALGPDVDMPKLHRRRLIRGADFAASAALDAAGSAAEHFIPMRGTIRQLSGAQRYDNHVKHATLAGETRRAFLKAVGMEHDCVWPAAPIGFAPAHPALVAALWVAPQPTVSRVLVAAAATPSRATMAAAVRVSRVTFVSAGPSRSYGPVVVAVAERLSIPSAGPGQQIASQRWRPPASGRLLAVSTAVAASATPGAAAPWAQSFATASARP